MPKVTMPQLGESVAEGTIGKWLKNVGDHVDKYEPIVEVITDKVNAEVPSPFEGTLTEILVKEGETVPNNAEIAVIEGDGAAAKKAEPEAKEASAGAKEAEPAEKAPEPAEKAAEAEPTVLGMGGQGPAGSDERPERAGAPAAEAAAKASTAPAATVPATPTSPPTNGAGAVEGYTGRMTPAVRRLAREHGVDLSLIQGSGHGGRVTRDDVMRFVGSGGTAAAAARSAPAASAPGAPTGPAPAAAPPPSPLASDELKSPSPMRKAIATQMTRALQVPVAYTTIEVDMSSVVGLRDSVKRDYQGREGIGLTFDAFVAKAAVEALRRHPDFNGHYTDEGHWRRKAVNVGVAVAIEDGLVVPVIKDADELSIHGLNKAIRDLADRARAGRLKLDDVQGGTFTVDNTGWTGSILTQPIINVPEVAILTMEMIVKRPVVVETPSGDTLGIRPMMNMCLGFDHRATDGAQAGRFVADIKRWLESVDAQTPVW